MLTSLRNLGLATAVAGLFVAGAAQAATIGFETSEGYTTTGNFASADATTTNRPFTGQQGWSGSTSNNAGKVVVTTNSGLYTGGQAVNGTGTGAGITYIGGKAGFGLVEDNAFTYDIQATVNEAYVGGWDDSDADNLYDQAEAEVMPGIIGGGNFGVRSAGFGAALNSGVTPTSGNWYRLTVTLDDANLAVTLSARNLTTNTPVDFDPFTDGDQDYSPTLTATQYGTGSSNYDGVTLRVTGLTTIDNLQSGAVPVPEPASLALAGLGGLAMLRRRRA